MKTIITFLTLLAFSTIFVGCSKQNTSPNLSHQHSPGSGAALGGVASDDNYKNVCRYLHSINTCLQGVNVSLMDSTNEQQIMQQYKQCSQVANTTVAGTANVVKELENYKKVELGNIGKTNVIQSAAWPTYLPEQYQTQVQSAGVTFSRCLAEKKNPSAHRGGLSYFPAGGSSTNTALTADQIRQHEERVQIRCERQFDNELFQSLRCNTVLTAN